MSSWRVSPDRQVVRGAIKAAPEGDTLVVKGPGCAAPTGTNNKGPGLSGLPKMTLGSSEHIPSK